MAKNNRWTWPIRPALLGDVTLPEYVKQASYDPVKIGKMPDGAFGLIVLNKEATHRHFPIYDKASTWLSGQYLNKTWHGMPKTAAVMAARTILGAADVHDISVPDGLKKVAKMIPTNRELEKAGRYYEQNPEDESLESSKVEPTGPSVKIAGMVMPITNPVELEASEEWFDRNGTKLAYADQYKLAKFISTKRPELTKGLEKSAEFLYQSARVTKTAYLNDWNPRLPDELLKRAGLCKTAESANTFVESAINSDAIKIGSFEAGVDFVHSLDKAAGITGLYDSVIPDPLGAVMCHTPTSEEVGNIEGKKEMHSSFSSYADPHDDTYSLGRSISVAELKSAAKSGKLARIIGDGLSASLATNTSRVYEELPEPIRRLIVYEIRKK